MNKGGNVSLVAGSDRPKTSAAEGWISSSGPYASEFFYRRCKCRSGTQVWSRISEVLWGASDARIASSTGEPGPTDRASLEIITGRIDGDAEQSKVFAVVRDQDGVPNTRSGDHNKECELFGIILIVLDSGSGATAS